MKFYRYIFVFLLLFAGIFLLASTPATALTEQQIAQQEAEWRAELEATEKEIAQWENILNQTKTGTASLERDADILNAKINEAKAFIRKRQIQINQLTRDIGLKTKTIAELEEKMNRGKKGIKSD